MRVLLVNLPPEPSETMFPCELATLATALKDEGHHVEGLDLGVRGTSCWPKAAEGYDAILWPIESAAWVGTRDLFDRFSHDDPRLLVAMGPHATLFPDEVLGQQAVDAVILGEAERAALGALRAWPDADLTPTPGVVWQQRWREHGFFCDRDFERIEQLGLLPTRDLDIFNVDDYRGMATRRPRYTQILAGRGSDRPDAHRPIERLLPGGRRTRPVEQVVEEMAALNDRFGVDEFHFEDFGLFEDRVYIIELCRAISTTLPDVVWQVPPGCHPEDLPFDLLEELVTAGCYRVYLQLDSTSPDAMRLFGRDWDPSKIERLATEARHIGLELGGYFTLGVPGESEAGMRETVRFAAESRLTWAQFTPFRFKAGSQLDDRRSELASSIPPQSLVQQIIRSAYWRFYGTQDRWRIALGNLNRRNSLAILQRTFRKMVQGRPFG